MLDPNPFENLLNHLSGTLELDEDAELIKAAFSYLDQNETSFFIDVDIPPQTKKPFDYIGYIQKSEDHLGFMKGSHNKVKLESSLAIMGNQGLFKSSLLNPEVGKREAMELSERLLRRAKKIDSREANKKSHIANRRGRPYKRGEKRIKLFSTYQSFRFLTILNSVVNLCPYAAVNEVMRMKNLLKEAFAKVFDVSCIGTFEVEVINPKMMREICDRTLAGRKNQLPIMDDSILPHRQKEIDKSTEAEEFRKLTVLESMGEYLNDTFFMDEQSQLLIHCHLIVCAPSDAHFNKLLKVLGEYSIWNKEPRQILMKSLTKQYGEKVKSVEDNLIDIAAYITKGGNDWVGKRPYLRYKIRFSSDTPMTEQELINQYWRSTEMLRKYGVDQEGIKDLLSLSVTEINVLAEAIDGIMKLEPKCKGHLFCVGRW